MFYIFNDRKPVFNKFEKLLHFTVDACLLIWCAVSIFPFARWIYLPVNLPFIWDNNGKPLQWEDKTTILFKEILNIFIGTLAHFIYRLFAENPSLLKYRGMLTPENSQKIYHLGRVMIYITMIEWYIFRIHESYTVSQSYILNSGNISNYISPTFFGIMFIISAVSYLISIIHIMIRY
jgi:hypothetical protein